MQSRKKKMKRWKIAIDHDVLDNNEYIHPYNVYHNSGIIFNNWSLCKCFKTIDEAKKFIEERQKAKVDSYGKIVIYYD